MKANPPVKTIANLPPLAIGICGFAGFLAPCVLGRIDSPNTAACQAGQYHDPILHA